MESSNLGGMADSTGMADVEHCNLVGMTGSAEKAEVEWQNLVGKMVGMRMGNVVDLADVTSVDPVQLRAGLQISENKKSERHFDYSTQRTNHRLSY